ncbi:Flp pilus assembly protein, protease CpaA [Pseudomonas syringae pv. syringae HS191]|nr:Flp pilus assembly protein, protease CpaA [Pseudomonas syringae pv. syringae HS191]KPB25958.1 Peptidase A24A [Pseudomonas syringae pv. syringae]RMM42122.1 Peptidase A24A, prepilin type IV [Pseudomonas syringae pv. aptata]RMS59266.1 Peptidase A24A, prepilin type IV [Pseudomonas syringae pv. aceris]RML72213.1 Peptidase A24A, prepilin type IV [Pseudomonas syringae pv. syringae]
MMKLFFLLIWFAICAEQDARCKQISNGLTLGAAALAIIYLALTGMTWLGSPALEALLAVTLAWALTLPGYALGKLGAADVKLMTALALASNSAYLLCTFIGAGLTMAAWLIVGKSTWPHTQQWVAQRYRYMNPGTPDKYPFSPFLFAGLLLSTALLH